MDEHKDDVDTTIRFCAYTAATRRGYGASQDDALAEWARFNGVRMWFEEGVA